MLSDACSDFVSDLEDGKPIEDAATELLKGVEWYGAPDYPIRYALPQIESLQIETLRTAAKDVLADPGNPHKARWLMDLAECVRAFHDMWPEGFDVERYAQWLRREILRRTSTVKPLPGLTIEAAN
jgi:hypothetical protein